MKYIREVSRFGSIFCLKEKLFGVIIEKHKFLIEKWVENLNKICYILFDRKNYG